MRSNIYLDSIDYFSKTKQNPKVVFAFEKGLSQLENRMKQYQIMKPNVVKKLIFVIRLDQTWVEWIFSDSLLSLLKFYSHNKVFVYFTKGKRLKLWQDSGESKLND